MQKWPIWKMSQVPRWEKMSFCESWPTRNGFKSLAHLLVKGQVMPKRVQSKGFICESCYLGCTQSALLPQTTPPPNMAVTSERHNCTRERRQNFPRHQLLYRNNLLANSTDLLTLVFYLGTYSGLSTEQHRVICYPI